MPDSRWKLISICTLCKEGDVAQKLGELIDMISIHALREEGDHKNQRVCAVGSQNGMDCFVQDDDGNGTLRGELVGNIQRCLERRDADYQTRWNRVWASALCQKYRRPESEDYWLWARAFFDAPIFDLQAIAALVQ